MLRLVLIILRGTLSLAALDARAHFGTAFKRRCSTIIFTNS